MNEVKTVKLLKGSYTMITYPRGSEWRKWDLHIHSNASDGNSTPSDIIRRAKELKLSVIAITDHHTVKNIDEIKRIAIGTGITVISGIEFRTELGQKSVHMIGLFPDEHNKIQLNQQALTELILNPLGLSETAIASIGRAGGRRLDNGAAFKAGMFQVQVNFKEAARKIREYGGIVTVHAGEKENGLEGLRHEGKGVTNVTNLADSLGPLKTELLNEYIDICEVSKSDESEFYLRTFKKPSIVASDAHSTELIGSKYTWIKADPTFNGLLQILCEPKARVSIQEDQPEKKADYSTIDYIELINPSFSAPEEATKIMIHPNLTCIIGGRSTGKSLLLNNIAYAIDSEQVSKKYVTTRPSAVKGSDSGFTAIDSFKVVWSDGTESKSNGSNRKKIVYIPQAYLNRLSDEREERTEIDELIEEILLQDQVIQSRHGRMLDSNKLVKIDTDKTVYDFIECTKQIGTLNEQLLSNNNSKTIEKEIAKLEFEKSSLKLGEEITEVDSNNYAFWQSELTRIENEKNQLIYDIDVVSSIEKVEIQTPIQLANLKSSLGISINDLLFSMQNSLNVSWISQRDEFLMQIKARVTQFELESSNLQKLIELVRPAIEKNVSLLAITKKINVEKEKLEKAKKIEADLASKMIDFDMKLDKLASSLDRYKNNILDYVNYVNEHKSMKTEGLEFRLEVVLRLEAFKKKILELINNKTLTRLKGLNLASYSESDYSSASIKQIILSVYKNDTSSLELKNQYTFETFLREILSDWFNLNYVVIMDNDEFDQMSPGKKALVLLVLLIALAQSDCPMLIDQPEDDLDNRSIFDDLVKYIKLKKIERQIIIVTHNANIVVGADAEEVIVANQDGKNTKNQNHKFEYRSGSIEDQWICEDVPFVLDGKGIQQHICEILEGGRTAFDLRKQKYYFIMK